MNEVVPTPSLLDARPATSPAPSEKRERGCAKWGLFGCAGISVVLIAGLVLFMRKAPEILDRVFAGTAEQVVVTATPDVTPEEKEAFRKAYASFAAKAREGRVQVDGIQTVQQRVLEALADGKVTAPEIRELTALVTRVEQQSR
jgi:hypothetical protein